MSVSSFVSIRVSLHESRAVLLGGILLLSAGGVGAAAGASDSAAAEAVRKG